MKKRFEGIDYEFRPFSYWEMGDDILLELLKNVKGTNRRKMIREYWESGAIELLQREIRAESLDEDMRERFAAVHPSFMGGEYLPDYREREVEIARLELQTTTSDAVSIRARRGPKTGRIRYAVVDEYEQEYVFRPKSSTRPLSLGELVDLIDGASPVGGFCFGGGLSTAFHEMNFECERDARAVRHLGSLTSEYYPELFAHFDRLHEEWVRGKQPPETEEEWVEDDDLDEEQESA